MTTTIASNRTATLGDRPINRMGYGAMQLAGPGVFGPPRDPDAARAVLRRAIELGVDHIDTSQYYGPDVVNDLIREALYPYPDNLRLVTKVGGARDAKGGWLAAQTPEELRLGVEDNLRSLGVERMDLVNLRLMGSEDGGPRVEIEDQLGALEDLRQQGKLDLIGVSNVNRSQLQQALALVDLGEVQNPYSVIDRADEELLELCAEHGVAFVPFFPLGSAFDGGFQKIAEEPTLIRVAREARCEHVTGRAGVAVGPLRADVAHSWDLLGGSPRGELRGDRARVRRSGHGRAGRRPTSRRAAALATHCARGCGWRMDRGRWLTACRLALLGWVHRLVSHVDRLRRPPPRAPR